MKQRYIVLILVLTGFATFQSACKKEKVPEPFLSDTCPDTVFYQTKIRAILDVNCSTSGCHDATGAGGIKLLTHFQVSDEANRVLKAIRHEGGVSSMPLGAPKLPDSIGDQVSCWINQGKLNN